MPLHVRVLGSSSSGNCTIVWNERSALLIDCGFHPRYIHRQLRALDLKLPSIAGVIITHTHGDHVHRAALSLFTREGIPVACPESVHRVLQGRHAALMSGNRNPLPEDGAQEGSIGEFTVRAFPVPHDAEGGCFGYRIAAGRGADRRTVAVATDLGFAGEEVLSHVLGTDAMVIESNHDPEMLENSGRPAWLKERIRSIGHLSNPQCAGLVLEAAMRSASAPRAVILAHISRQCNTRERALACTADALLRQGVDGTRLLVSYPWEANDVVTV